MALTLDRQHSDPYRFADQVKGLIRGKTGLLTDLEFVDDGVRDPLSDTKPDLACYQRDSTTMDAGVRDEMVKPKRAFSLSPGEVVTLQRIIRHPVSRQKHQCEIEEIVDPHDFMCQHR